jgi:hypothetical protein
VASASVPASAGHFPQWNVAPSHVHWTLGTFGHASEPHETPFAPEHDSPLDTTPAKPHGSIGGLSGHRGAPGCGQEKCPSTQSHHIVPGGSPGQFG